MRSPTAVEVVTTWSGIEANCAGLSADADEPLSREHIEWSNIIFVMEKRQRARLSRKFGRHLGGRKIVCLNIPDKYDYMDTALITRLQQQLHRYFGK